MSTTGIGPSFVAPGQRRPMPLELANEADVPLIMEMTAACIAHMRRVGIDQWDEDYPTADVFRDDVRCMNLFVVKQSHGIIVGCATLDAKQPPAYANVRWSWADGSVGVVHRLMVAPQYAGRGIAKLIMAEIELEATRRGYMSIRLDAFTQNPAALRLYTGLGYRGAGEVRFRKGAFACFERQLGTV